MKRQVFGELEEVVSDECVLATNTSALSVTAMGEDLEHAERLVGTHFFDPVALMPLVEIVRTPETDDSALATAWAAPAGQAPEAFGACRRCSGLRRHAFCRRAWMLVVLSSVQPGYWVEEAATLVSEMPPCPWCLRCARDGSSRSRPTRSRRSRLRSPSGSRSTWYGLVRAVEGNRYAVPQALGDEVCHILDEGAELPRRKTSSSAPLLGAEVFPFFMGRVDAVPGASTAISSSSSPPRVRFNRPDGTLRPVKRRSTGDSGAGAL